MFPKTLTTALYNYLAAETWNRDELENDPDLRRVENARIALSEALEAPYPTDGESLMRAVREFMHARATYDQCCALHVGLDQAAEQLRNARRRVVNQLRSFECKGASAVEGVYNSLLVAIDHDEQAEDTVRAACDLASKLGATIVLLHVVTPRFRLVRDPLASHRRQAVRRRAGIVLLDRAGRLLPAGIPVARMLREGVPAAQIVNAAKALEAKMILIGTPCRGRLAHVLRGSTSEAVIRDAHCPVVTISHERPAGAMAQLRTPPTDVLGACA